MPVKVYVPLHTAQQSAVENVLRDSGAFTLVNTGWSTCAVPVEWVMLPPMDEPADADDSDEEDTDTPTGSRFLENTDSLEEMWEHPFEPGDYVWVRAPHGSWLPGQVTRQPPHIRRTHSGDKECVYYSVEYRHRATFRRYFAPMNGEMKPDTARVRELLKEGGWL
ncbi:hypothetical protein SCP_0115900 [Sparassis crispa]|uniref:Uncharacterized protein n=1 Tax=Sparassis crispa TaxID=139825 RepID=A0A401G977_9APHY|nr:hypothetical protein SCP_0115900 [Sparassis crispa]GBE78699.1 hypothetical protein SCP_0115900 [Sparassis crispa]